MRHVVFLLVFLVVCTATACVDAVVPQYDYQTGFFLVEGSIVNRSGASEVRISRSELQFGTYKLNPLSDATVSTTSDGAGEVTWRKTEVAGTYRPDSAYVPEPGRRYVLRVVTATGEIIESEPEVMPEPVGIGDLRMRFAQEAYFSVERDRFVPAFTLLLDVDDPPNADNFYRHRFLTWSETAICATCYNSVYRNGECIHTPRVDYYDYLCDGPCWTIARGKALNLLSDELNPNGSYRNLPVGQIDFVGSGGLLAEVQQYALSRSAYGYYKVVEGLTEGSAGLNAPLPAALYGNMRDLSDRQSNVLGYVAATSLTTRRLYWNRDSIPGTPLVGTRVPQLEPLAPSPPSAPCSGPNFTRQQPEGWRN